MNLHVQEAQQIPIMINSENYTKIYCKLLKDKDKERIVKVGTRK